MVTILEKGEHNIDFHPMVDFVEASPLRYALTFKPTIYVSHIRQFWSTARNETTEEGTKILTTVDGILRIVTESSLRRNLKLQDEDGISSLPDTKLFENLSLMGYNIHQNQKFTFQKGTPTEPHHTPSPEVPPSSHNHISSPSPPTVKPISTALIPTITPSETIPLRQYTQRARIAQSSTLPLVADEPASPVRDVNQGEACPTESGFIADQDRTTIYRSSTLPHDSATRVTSPAAVEGSSGGGINKLKERVKLLEDGKGMAAEGSRDDALIKGRSYTIYKEKGKEKMVETHIPKKKKRVQEQIDIKFARELEEELEREAQRMNAQIARDEEITKIHAEEKLQQIIAGLDRSNETIAKHLEEYDQAAAELTIRERIELISELNEITNFHQRPDESLFEAWERYKLSTDRCPNHNMFPVTQIDTFYNGLTLRHCDTINAATGRTFMKRRPEECYDLIENVTAHHNDWDTSAQRSESSSSITSSFDTEITALKAEMAEINKNLMRVHQPPLATPRTYMPWEPIKLMNTASSSILGTLSGDIITNPKEELKGIITRSGIAYQGPTIPTTYFFLPLIESSILNSEPIVAPIIKPVVSLVSAPKPNQKPLIPYPSRLHDQKLRDKANDQREKFFQIFKDLNFNISFADALIPMPKFGPTIKTLLTNKDKLSELARSPLNEHFSAVILKKLLEKLGDPGKFFILCDFPRMAECLALGDLGTSINLMPLSVWNKLSLPDLSPTCMTLELADRSISHPIRVVEDVFVKVGTFHFSADFVVVDFDADPRVPLILGRYFLKTKRALIDVFEGKLTLRVGKEATTFNLDQTSRYSANYNDITANQIDVIDIACKEYSQEVLNFSDVIASGNPTPYYDLIVSTTSPTLTLFGNSDFLLEEVDAFLVLEDDPTSPEVDQSYVDTEGDILLLKAFLNDDPSLPLQIKEIIFPKFVELKDLPPHLEYAFLEGDEKLPVIIAKDLSAEEKTALITVLKSHNRAIAWKLSDIKGIDPEFYTLKILMEEDFEPVVQHQRRVNPKIHDVIKNEVLKLLDAGLIYPISDSWHLSSLAVGSSSGSGNSVTGSGNALCILFPTILP
uniref:Reverse transcriptase domain-containing protein n=1 Tax=Tanacetum cinerariifolium TaxID=118510 RepID=A0A6L2N146_TANCI|nr:reverse transcriptase domain-containing protein [Tanacetum cinerariifolium]